jgi:hypothetical protein
MDIIISKNISYFHISGVGIGDSNPEKCIAAKPLRRPTHARVVEPVKRKLTLHYK